MNIELYQNISHWSFKLILVIALISIIPFNIHKKKYLHLGLYLPLLALIFAITYELVNRIIHVELAPSISIVRIDLIYMIVPLLMFIFICALIRSIIAFKKKLFNKNKEFHFFIFSIILIICLFIVWIHLVSINFGSVTIQ